MFDNTETDSLELLRFYPSLTAIAGFEDALHERVRQVGRIPDHAFPLIVAVERLEGDGALALVSTHTPGKRLSTFFDKPGPRRGLNPAFVAGIVTQVIQALTVLQSKGDGITHSALTPDRVVVTTGGRICVIEHVLGLALRQLNLSASQLWREFGLVTPPGPDGEPYLDARTDVFQLGVLALEMLLGRRLSPLDLKDRLPDLLDQWSDAAARAGMASDRLRQWLERALQLGSRGYATAADAFADLRDMPSESTASAFDSLPMADVEPIGKRSLQPARLATGQDSSMANSPMANGSVPEEYAAASLANTVGNTVGNTVISTVTNAGHANAGLTSAGNINSGNTVANSPLPARPALVPTDGRWADAFLPEVKTAPVPVRQRETPAEPPLPEPAPVAPAAKTVTPPPAAKNGARSVAASTAASGSPLKRTFKAPLVSPWIAAALGVVALLEGVVITAMLMRQPTGGASSSVSTPVPQNVAGPTTPPPASAPVAPIVAPDQKPAVPPASLDDPIKAAQGKQRNGGVRLNTPIDLSVLQGDKVLGNSGAGPIIAPAGTYSLELVNASLGVKLRQPITFRQGEITKLDVVIPPGRLSVNAQPWANFSIDGQARGETPQANLSVPVGEHEIVFRHPDLGEKRVNVVVRADQPARASVSFDR